MTVADAWRLVTIAALISLSLGCSATGKSLIGVSAPSLQREDRALRAAVEKDPFPRAQGLTASGTS